MADNMVPESDLLAVKAKLEKVEKEYQEKLDQLSKQADDHYKNYLSEQATRSKLSEEFESLKKQLEQLSNEKSLREKAEGRIKELESTLLESHRARLSQVYNIPSDKLANKTLTDLTAIEEAIKLVGHTASRFDGGTGSTPVDKSNMSTLERFATEFDELDKRRSRWQ